MEKTEKLPAITGENIFLSDDGSEATRYREFGGAVCFTHRPLEPGEQLVLKVVEFCKGWSGNIRLGVTDVDPSALEKNLPKFLCPDLHQKARIWGKLLESEDRPLNLEEKIVISFDELQGKVMIWNGDSKPEEFIRGVPVRKAVYLIFDVYGGTRRICIGSRPECSPLAQPRTVGAGKPPRSMIFRNLTLIPAFLAPYVSESICVCSVSAITSLAKTKRENFAVTETPLMSNCAFVIRIDRVKIPGPMEIVLTTEDPEYAYSHEKINDIRRDSDSISFETKTLRVQDEFVLAISKSGDVHISPDNIIWRKRGQVDPDLKYYAVLDMTNVSRLSLVGIAMLD